MTYRELLNVALGTKGQLEACINALDRHDNAPEEVEALTDKLVEAGQICDEIIKLGEDEPEEGVPDETTESSGESRQASAETKAKS